MSCHPQLDHRIVVNWVISEHKSQGFFQMEGCRRTHEHFWLFEVSGEAGTARWRDIAHKLEQRGIASNRNSLPVPVEPMQQRKAKPKPFQNSLSALAQVAARETGADGYALFRRSSEGRGLVRHDSGGADISEDAVTDGQSGLVVYRLGADGVLAFLFQDETGRGRSGRNSIASRRRLKQCGRRRKRREDIRNSRVKSLTLKCG